MVPDACCHCRQVKAGRRGVNSDLPFYVISKDEYYEYYGDEDEDVYEDEYEDQDQEQESSKDSATSQWLDLPYEIISDILSRLPINSLLRCRLVSKHWNLLTRTSQFINLYRMSQISRHSFAFPSLRSDNGLNSLFVFQKDDDTIRIPFEHNLQGESYYVHSSCNGFLLLRDTVGRTRKRNTPPITPPKLIIYNPITKETILNIPDQPTDASYPVAFGFDAKTNQYKLVLQHDYIITLGQTCWRKLSASPRNQPQVSGGRSVFINGAFYWTDYYSQDVIISLDIYTEKYTIIQGVATTLKDANYILLEYDNKLAYIAFHIESQQLQIWSLAHNQNNTIWIHLSTNNITDMLSKHYCKQHYYRFVGQVGNDGVLFYHMDADISPEYPDEYDLGGNYWYRSFIYTPNSEGGHVINLTSNRLESWFDHHVFHFIPNLALLQNTD